MNLVNPTQLLKSLLSEVNRQFIENPPRFVVGRLFPTVPFG